MHKDVVHTCNGILLSHKKKKIYLEGMMLSEVGQTEKDKYCVIPHICGI